MTSLLLSMLCVVKSPSPWVQGYPSPCTTLHLPVLPRLPWLWGLGVCMCWDRVPARSVPELQAAGKTQWSIPRTEQPLGPNKSKSSPSRPFRPSHITQSEDVCWNLFRLGRHQQMSAAQPKSSLGCKGKGSPLSSMAQEAKALGNQQDQKAQSLHRTCASLHSSCC